MNEEQEKWYQENKSKYGNKLALLLSSYRYKRDLDNSLICDPVKHVLNNPTSMTAICIEIGEIDVNELRVELGF